MCGRGGILLYLLLLYIIIFRRCIIQRVQVKSDGGDRGGKRSHRRRRRRCRCRSLGQWVRNAEQRTTIYNTPICSVYLHTAYIYNTGAVRILG